MSQAYKANWRESANKIVTGMVTKIVVLLLVGAVATAVAAQMNSSEIDSQGDTVARHDVEIKLTEKRVTAVEVSTAQTQLSIGKVETYIQEQAKKEAKAKDDEILELKAKLNKAKAKIRWRNR